MILICGLLSDPVLRYICAGSIAEGIDFLLLDPRQYPGPAGLSFSIDGEGRLEGNLIHGSKMTDLADLRSAFTRMPSTVGFNPGNGPRDGVACDASLNALLECLPCLVVNRPSAQGSNSAKPYQQQLIQAKGFVTPRTLVTSDPEAAERFYEACSGRVIYKSISGVRSIVRRLRPEQLSRLHHLSVSPVQFQEWIDGEDIRVHTVGSEVFATRVVSQADDYRYASRQGASARLAATRLPPEVEGRCLRLAHDLGLPFAGIDLRRTVEGRYYCFEVNPSPAFTYYESQTGQPIGAALIRLLSRTTLT